MWRKVKNNVSKILILLIPLFLVMINLLFLFQFSYTVTLAHWGHIFSIILFFILYIIINKIFQNKPGMPFIIMGILFLLIGIAYKYLIYNINNSIYIILIIILSLLTILFGILLNYGNYFLFRNKNNKIKMPKRLAVILWRAALLIFYVEIVFNYNYIYFILCQYKQDRTNILKQSFAFEIVAPKELMYPYSHLIKSCDLTSYYLIPYHYTVGATRIVDVLNSGKIIRKMDEIADPGITSIQDCDNKLFYIGSKNGILGYQDKPNGITNPIVTYEIDGKPDVVQFSNDRSFFLIRNDKTRHVQVFDIKNNQVSWDQNYIGDSIAPIGNQGILLCQCDRKVHGAPSINLQKIKELKRPFYIPPFLFERWVYCARDDIEPATFFTFFHSGDLVKVDDNGNILFHLKLGTGIRYPILDLPRQILFVPNFITGNLFIVNISNGKIINTVFTGRRTRWPHISPDDSELLVASSTGFYGFFIDKMIKLHDDDKMTK